MRAIDLNNLKVFRGKLVDYRRKSSTANGSGMFNDMLGTTQGTVKDGKYSASKSTLFGEFSQEKSNEQFFTGKPNVDGIGYSFLFRSYRPELAKWTPNFARNFEFVRSESEAEQTSDPLGYPDGFNNFAYVNNGVTKNIDFLGCVTIIYRDPAAGGHHWVEIHRNNRITTAAGFYPTTESVLGDIGQVKLGKNETYASGKGDDKQVLAVYQTTAAQELALIQTAYDAYHYEKYYNINPLTWPTGASAVCWHFTDLIEYLAENMGLSNDSDTYSPADRDPDSNIISNRDNLTLENMRE